MQRKVDKDPLIFWNPKSDSPKPCGGPKPSKCLAGRGDYGGGNANLSRYAVTWRL